MRAKWKRFVGVWLGIGGVLWLAMGSWLRVGAAEPVAASHLDFFEKKIRPVLVDKCYSCHSAQSEKVKGGLTLDTREGIRRGGDSGPAVVPGNLDESLLIQAIRYENDNFAMPPAKSGGKLPASVIRDFEEWVRLGAPDPREGAVAPVANRQEHWEKAKAWWAWQPPKPQAVPAVRDAGWPLGDIDRFVLAAQERKGVHPVGDADKLTLIRRVYFDLIGLPPSPEQAQAFLTDKSTNALERVVDRLLQSPQFGERWGRHWLDVARYAESTGKDVNLAYTHAWRYRDYVIASFASGKPYDQFIREQIAGDLLPAKDDRQRAEQWVATGFLAIGTKSINERNPRQFLLDVADEQVDTMSQAILGATVACARCHDHKFDPITQREYYALAGVFTSTDTLYGTSGGPQNRRESALVELPAGAGARTLGRSVTPDELERKRQRLAELRAEQQEMIREVREERRAAREPDKPESVDQAKRAQQRNRLLAEIGRLESELKLYDEQGRERPLAMGVSDLPAGRLGAVRNRARGAMEGRLGGQRPPEFAVVEDCALYARGEVDKPGEKVPRGVPGILSPGKPPAIPPRESGRREVAEWLTSKENPLTARVWVNRVWGWLLGRPLVPTPDNFGTSGSAPSHPELLDVLALGFMENGWNTKALIREIVLSRTYRLASTLDEKNFQADPENALVWRRSPGRLDAECIRDAMLAVSGTLDLTPPVGSAVARAGEGPVGGARLQGVAESQINGDYRYRSVYLPVPRDLLPESLALFDFAEPSLVTGQRDSTSVPAQALYLLNSEWTAGQARAMARRLEKVFPSGEGTNLLAHFNQKVDYAYWLAFARPPELGEKRAAAEFFRKFAALGTGAVAAAVAGSGESRRRGAAGRRPSAEGRRAAGREAAAPDVTLEAWASFCRALFAAAEFRYTY